MPKLYFYDVGLATSLLKVDNSKQLSSHYMIGNLFENMIILDILKARFNKGLQSNIYFWRDSMGHEIDCIIEKSQMLVPVEVKSGRTFNFDFFSGLKYWNNISGNSTENTFLIYGGDKDFMSSEGNAIGWKNLIELDKCL